MRTTFLLALAATWVAALPASAQEVAIDPDELSDAVQIIRSEAELTDALRVPVPDRDSVESVLVFTSKGRWAVVKCVGLNARGAVVGKAWTRVRPNGLGILFASDLTDGTDIVGSVRCASRSRVAGSGFLLVPGGISQLPVEQRDVTGAVRTHFPVVATF